MIENPFMKPAIRLFVSSATVTVLNGVYRKRNIKTIKEIPENIESNKRNKQWIFVVREKLH